MISVILPVYNTKREWLEESFMSIMTQSFPYFELIIVNDCSSDPDTQNYLKLIENQQVKTKYTDKRVRVIHLKENSGPSAARNVAVKAAKYPWIATQDADDISFRYRFEKQMNYLYENPEVDVLGAQLHYMVLENGEWLISNHWDKMGSTKHHPIVHKSIAKMPSAKWFINHCPAIYKKSMWEAVGGYDESLRGLPEDFDLWVRMLVEGANIHNLQESLYYYRLNDGSHSTNLDNKKEEWFWNEHVPKLKDKL